jgi:signal transduction histidine kinase
MRNDGDTDVNVTLFRVFRKSVPGTMDAMPAKMFIPLRDAANPFFRRFSSLRWKLVFSYVGVTLLTVLALELAVLLLLGLFGEPIGDLWVTQTVLGNAGQLAKLASGPLEDGAEDQLTQVLFQPMGLVVKAWIAEDAEVAYFLDEARVVVDPQRIVVASNWPDRYPAGSRFQERGFPRAEILVENALENGSTASYLSKEINVFAAAVPISGRDGKRIGALYYHQPRPALARLSPGDLIGPLVMTTLGLLPCMIPLGLVFAFVTATGFTRRLRRLSQASLALAGGDLSQRVVDHSSDEIGQLSRQFNRMAEQLESDKVNLRELAAVEERHRLARDLHDGVKQNLFGANLATAAAINLVDSDPEAARVKMMEVREHNRRAQAEMQALLDELRPAGFSEREFPDALKEYLIAFGKQQGLKVEWKASGDASLPPDRQQTLFRVAQEALTNVARHARAGRVTVELSATPEAVILRIEDDGRGFEPAAVQAGITMGLRGMRERLSEVGGTLVIDSMPGAGTRLLIRLPGGSPSKKWSKPHA